MAISARKKETFIMLLEMSEISAVDLSKASLFHKTFHSRKLKDT
jgi:hypothetical protein